MIDRATRALNQREVDMDFCDKSHKMNSPPELRIKNSQRNYLDIEMKTTSKLEKDDKMEKQKAQPL